MRGSSPVLSEIDFGHTYDVTKVYPTEGVTGRGNEGEAYKIRRLESPGEEEKEQEEQEDFGRREEKKNREEGRLNPDFGGGGGEKIKVLISTIFGLWGWSLFLYKG